MADRRGTLFPAWAIIRGSHHRGSPERRGQGGWGVALADGRA